MTTGLIFDIKEFAINDGPGIRLTVFMKGCPLRCAWCHNPEGISPQPQHNRKTGCMVGKEYTVEELTRRICKFRDVFDLSGGGVTFSGGEPTRQSEFIEACALRLNGIHKTLDTSGFCPSATFRRLLGVFDLVYYDLKLADTAAHQRFTGQNNLQILENLHILDESGVPYHIRIPLIPEITDTEKNLSGLLDILAGLRNKPQRVDPLPYNILAGGKYDSYGMAYPLQNASAENNRDNIARFKTELCKRKIRPGSGSAMYYIWLVNNNSPWAFEPKVKATADGRLNGEAFSTSLAPSHGIKVDGVLSVLKSYSVIDYSRIMNGGPITIELSPSVFKSDDGIKKLAGLIKYFVKLGDQQLQLNVLDASVLEDAIAHPEKHRNLIVRVWGWSGYFTELAPEYQQHVLNRHKYNI